MPFKFSPYRLAWSYRIGRIFGIDIKVHVIFLALLAFFFIRAAMDDDGGLMAGLLTLMYLGIGFFFVLLHELGHSVAAQKLGIRVVDITLWPLGGMARLTVIPEHPATELRIALAGPAVNFAALIATILIVWVAEGSTTVVLLMERAASVFEDGIDPVSFIIFVNAAMGLFNLVPAFPLDGGRILRALAARKLPYLKATELAVRIGKILAVSCLFLLFLNGELFSSFTLTLICLFVWWAGSFELRAARAREFMKGARQQFDQFFTRGGGGAWPGGSAPGGPAPGGPAPGGASGGAPGGPDIIEAEVLSATTEGEGDSAAPAAGKGSGTYKNLPEEEFARHRKQFEQEFLRMVEKFGKGGS